jgi:predicted RNase H-like nuclease (RuvC/YqgF family)
LANIEPERKALQSRSAGSQAALEAIKLKIKQIETERKRLELEVEAHKQQIEKYSIQQFQTKKNDEYKALANEIETCRAAIVTLEDQQLELMEQGDTAHKEWLATNHSASEIKKMVVREVMGRAIPVVTPDARIESIMRLVNSEQPAVLVQAGSGAFEIITKYDILNAVSKMAETNGAH